MSCIDCSVLSFQPAFDKLRLTTFKISRVSVCLSKTGNFIKTCFNFTQLLLSTLPQQQLCQVLLYTHYAHKF
jgi:hypothetical protein